MHNDSHNFDDIEHLNEELYKEEEKIPLNEEEKKELRKKILLLIGGIIIFLIIFVFVYLFLPKARMKKKVDNKEKVKEEVIVEKSLKELKDGNIKLNHSELLPMIKNLNLLFHDNENLNLIPVFEDANFTLSEASDDYKLFFASKTTEFEKYLREKGINTCNTKDFLSNEEIKDLVKKTLNLEINEFKDQKLVLYFNNYYLPSILSNDGEKYSISCSLPNDNLKTNFITTNVVKASKVEDEIILDVKALFFNFKGIFSDTKHQNKLHDDPNAFKEELFEEANIYKFRFKLIEGKYYLDGRI